MDSNLPSLPPSAPASEQGTAAQAFTQLAEKVAMLEAAIAGLSAKREAMPDYSETLGEIAALLEKIRKAINTLAHRPAMEITPDAMAGQILAAGAKARAADSAIIAQARDRMDKAAARIEYLEGKVRTRAQQRWHMVHTGIGTTLAVSLLWLIYPGWAASLAPDGWNWPERVARRTIGEPTLWDAGIRLMRAGNPQGWQAVVDAADMARENRDALAACTRAAAKAKKPVRCTVEIRPAS